MTLVNLEKIIYVKVFASAHIIHIIEFHPVVYRVSLFIFYPQGGAMGLLALRYWQICILMINHSHAMAGVSQMINKWLVWSIDNNSRDRNRDS